MKCYIVTKADPDRFKVDTVVKRHGWIPTYVCDNDAQRKLLLARGISSKRIVLSDVPKDAGIQGVSMARDFVCRTLMLKGEWSIWIDDNVYEITGLKPCLSTGKIKFDTDPVPTKGWRLAFEYVPTPKELQWHIDQTLARAEEVGTIFCGFANETNYYFRGGKWQDRGYCRTQFALYKNDGTTWFPFETMMLEDMYKSIDVECRYGSVVINRHVKPMKKMFEQGGIGSFAERLPWLQDNCRRFMEMYPGLLKYSGDGKMYGIPATEYHVKFAFQSQKTLDAWRKENGYF